MIWRLIAILATILTYLSCSAGVCLAQTSVVSGTIEFGDLPPGVEQRPTLGASNEETATFLSSQPSLTLGPGAQLRVALPTRKGVKRVISLNKLELSRGSQIIVEGNVEIYALEIASDGGEVVARDAKSLWTAAPDGTDGQPGISGGTILIYGSLASNDILHVNLKGQDGQPGGKGTRGPRGAEGTRGANAADHLFDCAHSGGNGGRGESGVRGGPGGAGGAGGNGGQLVLSGPIASQRVQVDFSALGGAGGVGGAGGEGGAGGPGGQGGHGSVHCGGGRAGPDGPSGQSGPDGADGPDGAPGGISAA